MNNIGSFADRAAQMSAAGQILAGKAERGSTADLDADTTYQFAELVSDHLVEQLKAGKPDAANELIQRLDVLVNDVQVIQVSNPESYAATNDTAEERFFAAIKAKVSQAYGIDQQAVENLDWPKSRREIAAEDGNPFGESF